jgi:RNA polymerase sigma-70 factor (ECF subfamily)
METVTAGHSRDSTDAEPVEPDEAALVARLQAGEDSAYEELLRAQSGRMLAVARRFLPSEDDALEAVQEAFVSAFKAIDRFQGGARLSTWLHRITVNACLMKLRTRRRKPEESIEEQLPGWKENGHAENLPSAWPDAADVLIEQGQTRALVRAAIDRLPEGYRTVLLLRDIEEFDTEETAKALGLTRAAVKTRLHRARQALRERMDEHFRASREEGRSQGAAPAEGDSEEAT